MLTDEPALKEEHQQTAAFKCIISTFANNIYLIETKSVYRISSIENHLMDYDCDTVQDDFLGINWIAVVKLHHTKCKPSIA